VPPFRRARSLAVSVSRALLTLIAIVLVLVAIAIGLLETTWGKGELRALIVRQANQYLTATLEIGRLGGSVFRGLELDDVTLTSDGRPLIAIDSVNLEYSIRELLEHGTVIRRIALTRPRVVASKLPDGRWDIGAIVRRNARQQQRTGPGRAIEIQSIEVVDASVALRDPLQFGAAHVPTDFSSLNATMSFSYAPVRWTLAFTQASWVGRAPDLSVTRLAGRFGRDSDGWFFDRLSVETARSAFTLSGGVLRGDRPTTLDLAVHADRFAFQEWSGVLTGLKNIAVEASFDTSLKGPLDHIDTQLMLGGTGGSVSGRLALDTNIPGWHGTGAVDVAHIQLAHWLNRADRPSDITGHVVFDLDLDLGRHFPRGTYTFDGPHAMYMDYAADDLHAAGRLTARDVLIDRLAAVAYRAHLSPTTGSIGLDSPFPYHFQGSMSGLDLRQVPRTVPVPRVESALTFDYDARGRFARPFITGQARFEPSTFLGAAIGAGMVGTVDTETRPITYTGDGEIDHVSLGRFGEGLDVGWLRDPRYAGTVSGRFHVEGAGADREELALTATGRVSRADLFRGSVSGADVSLEIDHGTLRTSFNGRFAGIDPAIPFADARLTAELSGSADVRTTVQDLLTRTPLLADYDVGGRMLLGGSTIRGIPVATASVDAALAGGQLSIARLDVDGPALSATVSGGVAFNGGGATDLSYDVAHADLGALRAAIGGSAAGMAVTKGRLTGTPDALRAAGSGTASGLTAYGISALTLSGQYDVTAPAGAQSGLDRTTATITGNGSFLKVLGQSLESVAGTVALNMGRADFKLSVAQAAGREASVAGALAIHPDRQGIDLLRLDLGFGGMPWTLAGAGTPHAITWSDAGVAVSPIAFVAGAAGDERIDVSGTWREDGAGALHVIGTHVFLEALQSTQGRPPRIGGVIDLDAVVRGTRAAPSATGTFSITNGRVERVVYERLAGRVDFAKNAFTVDLRLDQSPDTWLTATGTVPLALVRPELPERPLDIAIASSSIDLGLLGGVTSVITRPSGQLHVDLHAFGTSRDPHFDGTVDIAAGAFTVAATGVPYKNIHGALRLGADRVTVESLHVEDEEGRALDVQGSLGTRELRVSDLAMDLNASSFEILRNEFGRIDVDGTLAVRGRFEEPRLAGNITIKGNALKVDRILERALFQPYATQPITLEPVDAVAALNPWQRLGLDVSLHVAKTLRLTGNDIQVTAGTPIGFGDINLRVGGDLYLYKDPGGPVSITGSLDQVSGAYVFQGRRFNIDEANSSINFVGDLDPQLYVVVTRDISAVQTRVTLTGSLHQPELSLSSNPPLDESDILSLIVFNTTPNGLTNVQQQELAVRAGTLAAGFLAGPLIKAIQSELGLETLEIATAGEYGTGPSVTIAEELAPGLIARFSRQFGQDPFDQATIEYDLSRLFRLRATFSDAQAIAALSPFRRVERAGIDFLVLLSF
jgi:hypothetical protein